MISKRNYFIYSVVLAIFIAVISWVLWKGGKFYPLEKVNAEVLSNLTWPPFTIFISQLLLIIFLSRLLGSAARRSRQPALMGEIIAGVMLGPSFFGLLFPSVYNTVFSESSITLISYVSQLGLILFLFVIGMDLDVKVLRNKRQPSVLISHMGILFPFALGIVIAFFWYDNFPQEINFYGFALFLAIGMSVSAFPVLARIIQERGLVKNPLGTLALTSASIDDITSWSLVALAIAVVRSSNLMDFLITFGLSALYFLFMVKVAMPVMKKMGDLYPSKETLNKRVMGSILGMLMLSTVLAELIGLSGLIGAFFAGVIMPRNLTFKKILSDRIEDVTVAFFLPLLFLYVGVNTNLLLLLEGKAWMLCGLVLIAAIAGKFVGVSFTAKIVGQRWKNSFLLGMLMNTRGLMGLIVITMGFQLGVFPPVLFTILVVLVFVATVLTNPTMDIFLSRKALQKEGKKVSTSKNGQFKILVSFGIPKMGSTLLRLADQLTQRTNDHPEITALHITPSSEVKPLDAILFEKEGFQPIRARAQLLDLKLNTIYKTTHEVEREILRTTQENKFDLILVGAARSAFTERMMGGKLSRVMEEGNASIGVLMDNGYVLPENILMLVSCEEDAFLLEYGKRFYKSSKSRITILSLEHGEEIHFINTESKDYALTDEFNEVIKRRIPDKDLLDHFNLVLVSLDCWNELAKARTPWMKDCPSVLVIKGVEKVSV